MQHLRSLSLAALFFLPALASAGGVHPDYRAGKTGFECDTLFLSNPNAAPIVGKVTSVELRSIAYIPCDNLEGPSYSIPRTQVHKIRYVNGKEEVLNALLPPPPPTTDPEPLAVGSLLLGLFGLIIGLLVSSLVGLILAFGGLVMGIAALARIRKSGRRGNGLAIAGIIFSGLTVLMIGLLVLFLIALFA
jgi:hypothetical protein